MFLRTDNRKSREMSQQRTTTRMYLPLRYSPEIEEEKSQKIKTLCITNKLTSLSKLSKNFPLS
jgi:hypothetical protein